MSLKQFSNTIHLILSSNQLNKFKSILKHLHWQIRKIFNLFPYIQRISKSDIIAESKYNGVSALINCMGMYDYNNMNLIKILLERGGIFFDIGANIGSYTLIGSEQYIADIYSFEAHPKTYLSLNNNIKLNNRTNIKTFNLAISEINGIVYFSNLIHSPINHIWHKRNPYSISVQSIRMDTFIEKNKIIPEFVKIDVEGYEYEVLLSFGKFLNLVKIFFVEYNPIEVAEINNLLSENFLGPFGFDFNTRSFNQGSKDHREDCIYINKKINEELSKLLENIS